MIGLESHSTFNSLSSLGENKCVPYWLEKQTCFSTISRSVDYNSHNSLDCMAIAKNSELLYISGSYQVGKTGLSHVSSYILA